MKINLKNAFSLNRICTYLFYLPRSVLSYPFVFLASFFLLRSNIRDLITFSIFITLFLISFFINTINFDVKIGHFILEMIFLFPLLFFISTFGKGIKIYRADLRIFCFLAFFLSLANITLFYGFPFRLPYVHYTQDTFSAFFYGGGPKIMTVIGFIGLIYELFVVESKNKSIFWIAISLINLIVPNYVTGIAIATISISISSIILLIKNRNRFSFGYLFLFLLFIFVALNIFSQRIDAFGRGTNFFQEINTIPKIMNWTVLVEAFKQNPLSMIFGFGIGQYTSEVGMWSLNLMETKSPIDFEMTDPVKQYFYPLISDIFIFNRGYMSTISGPQSSIVTIFGEMGIIAGTLFLVFFWATIYKNLRWNYPLMIGVLIFYSMFLLADNQHDNIIFAYPFIFSILALKNIKKNV